ncbi:MAG: DNA-binding protein [Candidatus Rokuibacteriota bacterium]|nr:MAG: DNA-binding protein [Candidatus Rokubacteria bacterium]
MRELPFTRRQALAVVGLLVGVLVAATQLLQRPATPAAQPSSLPVATAPPPQSRLFVDVVGAVRRPGLYRLRSDARIADALARAGGTTRKADLEQVNLAAPVADGEQVVVPRRLAPAASQVATGTGGQAAPTGPIHLSTATLEQLDSLPGVGPVTAQKILDYRAQHGAFRSVDELDAVPGIGPARLDELRGLVVP